MNYEETLTYLFSRLPMFQRIGAAAYKANLDNTLAIDKILEHPHRQFPCVHIAGTNGKGSTSHFLASIFQESGYKTGLYTSPHLLDFRERIKINGELISHDYIVEFVAKHKEEFEMIEPSFFEWTVGLAFDYFAHEKVDIAIIETGMGGRLDSTNIISPIQSIITNISYDHKQFLGDTLVKIAGEKAGIIKRNTPVIIGETDSATQDVFVSKANELQAPILFADSIFTCTKINAIPNLELRIEKEGSIIFDTLTSGLNGSYQLKNVATVLTSISELKNQFNRITDTTIHDGIMHVVRNTGLMGRWQCIQTSPMVLCDTAHNVAGIKEVLVQLKELDAAKIHFVLGFVGDKDVDEIIDLLPTQHQFYFCEPSIPRAMKIEILQSYIEGKIPSYQCFKSVEEAYRVALQSCNENEIVFVGGSTFVVADLLQLVKSITATS